MFIGCISDIHLRMVDVPECDILVISGDLTRYGADQDRDWIAKFLNHAKTKARYIVFIAGNHDHAFQNHPWATAEWLKEVCADGRVFYLQCTAVTIEGVVIWGSPWTPKYTGVFQFKSASHARQVYATIPEKVDVVITHGPPFGILDKTRKGIHVGDRELLEAIQRLNPQACVCGHVHEAHGMVEINGTMFVNACICDEDYNPVQSPYVIEVKPRI